MKAFMDKDFLLRTETAKALYHQYAAKMPIIDYHCHINQLEIADDRKFDNITQAWLGGDHYKWRMIRSNGVPEDKITGDAPDREKFQAFAEALPRAIGNPLHHWTHLELREYFDYDGVLNGETAEEVWNLCNEKLKTLSVRKMIEQSNVETVVTTDDPIDDLAAHKRIKEDPGCKVQVLPAWRPDKAVNVEKPEFADYIGKLAQASGVAINDLKSLKEALSRRMDHFAAMGCRASDHGLDYVPFAPAPEDEVDAVLRMGLAGDGISACEAEKYKYHLLLFLGKEYGRRGWVMQLHYAALRNTNASMFRQLGPDTGFDTIGAPGNPATIAGFLGALNEEGTLPKTILYSLNPNDNAMLGALIGCFQGTEAAGKIQHGSAWWFNDTKTGMQEQLVNLANLSILGNFIGMLTDSRSFLSYTRHEYFRRILCDLLGSWAENGEIPCDLDYLGGIVADISYNNVKKYFGF